MLIGKYFKKVKPEFKKHYFSGINFNSQSCKKNNVFFAIKGNKIDGNKFVNNAILNEILIDSKKRHNICYISKNKIFNNSNYKLNFLSKSGFKIYCNFELK